MSFLSALFRSSDTVKVVGEAIENVFTNNDEREKNLETFKAKTAYDLEIARLDASAMSGQVDINKIEASHPSMFIAGWRAFCGWVCAFALAYAYIIEPIARFIARVGFDYEGEFPVVNLDELYPLLLGLLGLGGLRSFDKAKGTDTKDLKSKK